MDRNSVWTNSAASASAAGTELPNQRSMVEGVGMIKDETLKRLADLFVARERIDLSLILDAAYNSGVADGIERQAKSLDAAMRRSSDANTELAPCWHCHVTRHVSDLVQVKDIGYHCADQIMCDATQKMRIAYGGTRG